MKDFVSHLHPTLQTLLIKLANKKFSVRDCSSERLDWVRAGCPIRPEKSSAQVAFEKEIEAQCGPGFDQNVFESNDSVRRVD